MHAHQKQCGAARAYQSRQRKRLAILLIGVVVSALEGYGGRHESHSLFLQSDAGHVGIEALMVGLSMYVDAITAGKPHTRRLLFAVDAYIKGALLVALAMFIGADALMRAAKPPEVLTGPLLTYAVIGLVGNVVQFLLNLSIPHEHAGHHGFTLHLAMDIGQSVAIIGECFLIEATGWPGWDMLLAALVALIFAPMGALIVRRGRREYVNDQSHPH